MSDLLKGFNNIYDNSKDFFKVHETGKLSFFCQKSSLGLFGVVDFEKNTIPDNFLGKTLIFFGYLEVEEIPKAEKKSYVIKNGSKSQSEKFLLIDEFDPIIYFPFFIYKDDEEFNFPKVYSKNNSNEDYHLINAGKVIVRLRNTGYDPIFYQIEHGDLSDMNSFLSKAEVTRIDEEVVLQMIKYIDKNKYELDKIEKKYVIRKSLELIRKQESEKDFTEEEKDFTEEVIDFADERAINYILSNDSDVIVREVYKRVGVEINKLEFSINDSLDEKVKKQMIKSKVSHSAAIFEDAIVVNSLHDGKWYFAIVEY